MSNTESNVERISRFRRQERVFFGLAAGSLIAAVMGVSMMRPTEIHSLQDLQLKSKTENFENGGALATISGLSTMVNAIFYLGTRRVRRYTSNLVPQQR